MRKASAYQNQLVELERWRREQVLRILASDTEVARLDAEVLRLEVELESTRTAVKVLSIQERKRVDRRSKTAPIIAALRETRAARKLARAAASPFLKNEMDALHKECLAKQGVLRKASGVFWGTYLLTERAAAAANKSLTPPRFKSWKGEGQVGMQIQSTNPMTTEEVFGDDTRAQLDPIPSDILDADSSGLKRYKYTKGKRKFLSRSTLRLRIGSVNCKPIWATFPVFLHRPLPPDHTILWVTVQRRFIADREKWTCQITVSPNATATAFIPSVSAEARGRSVAVNLGWRKRDNGDIRVGYVVDDQAQESEILVSARIAQRLAKSDDLRSIRDKQFDRAKLLVQAWSKTPLLPEWMAERLKFTHLWKAPRKLVMLVKEWKLRESELTSFSLASTVLKWLTHWYHRDRHLWQWEASNRQKAFNHRRHIFRCVAKELAQKYEHVAIGEVDLRDFAKKEAPEVPEKNTDSFRYQRALASPSLLRLTLKNAVTRYQGWALDIKAPYTPKCTACGHENTVTAELTYTCESCARMWDQDANASINILRAAQCEIRLGKPLAVPKITRSQRFAAAKAKLRAAANTDPT
jgi:hypothetical protein